MSKENSKVEDQEEFFNPIDPDKVAENPGLIPYPHTVGSPAFAPTETGVIKSRSMKAMEEQSNMQLSQIKEQIALLAEQAEKLQNRIEVSKAVYSAEMSFEPVIGSEYHLYARAEGEFVLSMVSPEEWGKKTPFKHFVASVRLLADRTWEVTRDEL
jgi:hypothetical protein